MKDFINAIGNDKKYHKIMVTFSSGKSGIYTDRIIEMLKSDPATMEIIDSETGEVLYYKEA